VQACTGLESPAQVWQALGVWPAEKRSCRVVQACAGEAQRDGAPAAQCRPRGPGSVEWKSWVCVSLVWQALGTWLAEKRSSRAVQAWRARPSGREILCISHVAGLGGVPQQSRDCVGLCSPGGVARQRSEYLWIHGLKGSSEGDHPGLRV
jgi:hypothetical protein